ncbi:hypothetical protein FHU13_004973 [Methylobacterium sp. R2-1]|nr:hypothetical protein [Methylobacterium sp. R2-1]
MMLSTKQHMIVWERFTTTIGVTTFLTEAGRMLEKGGLVAAALLLLSLLVYDIVQRHRPSRIIQETCI